MLLLLSTTAHAKVCGPYLLTVGARGPEYVSLPPEILRAHERHMVKAEEMKSLRALEVRVREASRGLTWGQFLFGRPHDEATRTLREARAAFRAESAKTPPRDLRRALTVREAQLVADLQHEAERVLLSSLHEPRPSWATSLKLADAPILETLEDGFTAFVSLRARGGRLYDVHFSVSRTLGFKAGLVIDEDLRRENPYYFDDFKIGTVLDENFEKRVAHTSVDRRLEELRLTGVTHLTRSRLAERMAASAVVRRQVHQVLRAARPVDDLQNHLLKTYLRYWTEAVVQDERKMLGTGFLIAGLTVKDDRWLVERALSEAIEASRRAPGGFSHLKVKDRLVDWRASHAGMSSSGALWFYVSDREDAKRVEELTYLDPRSAAYDLLTETTGVNRFDDPRFVANERFVHPHDHALDDVSTENAD